MEEKGKKLFKRQTALSANLVGFCQFLRKKGFRIGPNEIADALQALEIMNPFENPGRFQLALQSILAKTRKQQQQFPELFSHYWKELEKAVDSKLKDQKDPKAKKTKTKQEAFYALKDWLHGGQEKTEDQELATYSPVESITSRSFSSFSEEEMQEVAKVIRRIARKLAKKVARRKRRSKRKGSFDVKRTLRKNLRRGGEIIEFSFRKPKKDKWKLVLLCDVSQSMELYSRFLMQFIYAFQSAYPNIETFAFSTQLTRITNELKEENAADALRRIGEKVTHWSGGTRIGASFQQFLQQYGYKLLDNKTYMIILSDGWDVGETALLETAMQRIHRKVHKVIWLNPLAGNPEYSPEVKGMKAALPYVDVFASVHNVNSLTELYRYL